VTLTNCTVSGNTAGKDAGGIEATNVDLTNSTVSGNTAGGNGGGINAGAVTLTGSTVQGNVAAAAGGGIEAPTVTLTNCTVAGNHAGEGGGIFAFTAVKLTDCIVSGNFATNNGGGIETTTATLTRCTVNGNKASANIGGGIFAGTATLTGCTVSGNSAALHGGGLNVGGAALTGCTISGNRAGDGGGIAAGDPTTLTNTTVQGNTATTGDGGGLQGGTFTLINSTVSGNTAMRDGGGISAASVTLTGCTVSGNSAGNDGGGIFASDGLALLDVTFTANGAHAGGGVFAGGPANVRNTIIAQNFVDPAGAGPDVFGTFTSGGHNLIGDGTGGTGFANGVGGDQVGTAAHPIDPRLGPLANNGGPTPTQALLPGSPAIGHADAANAPATDQRGFPRLATPSIGAYEAQYAANASANQVLVENFYEVLLGRPADPGSAGFVNELNAGVSPTIVVLQIEGSAEYRADQVKLLYQRYLHRSADAGGLQGFTAFLGSGGTLEQVAAMLIGSQEYFDLHGGNNDGFVSALFEGALGRPPDPGALVVFGQLLAGGMPRGQLASVLLSSAEYQSSLVRGDFQAVLGREPGAAELAFFVGELQQGGNDQLVLAQVLGSGEAFSKRA
jgi:predicted outer membrane repeat protein